MASPRKQPSKRLAEADLLALLDEVAPYPKPTSADTWAAERAPVFERRVAIAAEHGWSRAELAFATVRALMPPPPPGGHR